MWVTGNRKTVQFAAVLIVLALLLALPAQAAVTAKPDESVPVRVGLYYGSTAAPTFNLENEDGYGSGYRFGYFDSALNFIQLGYTGQTQISVLKSQNIYLTSTKSYTNQATAYGTVGSYHVQLPGSYWDYDSARAAADQAGGFVAWINGTYYVRVGSYTSAAEASAAAAGYGGSVGETSSYGLTVTVTGTTTILFQFDDQGTGTGLGIRPGQDDWTQTRTWCKGYRYYGSFRYQRIGGGDITLVNLVNMDDYVNCVISQEMSDSWPIEALKAQAVAARNYYAVNRGKHGSSGFDICASTHCQAYLGASKVGSGTTQAAAATSGEYLWYNGELAETYYFSSDGGATESSENVWTASVPYLRGVSDPYESAVAGSISNYQWSYTFTGVQLQSKLAASGRANCGVVTSATLTATALGNVYSITFHDANGKDWTLYKEECRTVLGLPSMRFGLGSGPSAGTSGGGGVWVNGVERPTGTEGLYAVDGAGNKTALSGAPYVITGTGSELLTGGGGTPSGTGGSSTNAGSSFVFSGSGSGHNVGMSQWGANAMAKQGFDYRSILTFYYTGVTLG